jgi:hypothetical protein
MNHHSHHIVTAFLQGFRSHNIVITKKSMIQWPFYFTLCGNSCASCNFALRNRRTPRHHNDLRGIFQVNLLKNELYGPYTPFQIAHGRRLPQLEKRQAKQDEQGQKSSEHAPNLGFVRDRRGIKSGFLLHFFGLPVLRQVESIAEGC